MATFDRIRSDPRIMGGQATVRGFRLAVTQIQNMVAHGMTVDDVLREFPFLETEDVLQALGYRWKRGPRGRF